MMRSLTGGTGDLTFAPISEGGPDTDEQACTNVDMTYEGMVVGTNEGTAEGLCVGSDDGRELLFTIGGGGTVSEDCVEPIE